MTTNPPHCSDSNLSPSPTNLSLISRRKRLGGKRSRAQKRQHLIHRLGDLQTPLLPVTLGPQALEHVVGHDGDDEADVVVLGGPRALVRVVDEVLDVARVDGVLCLLGRLGLVELRGGGVAREEVVDELVPGAADVDAVEPSGGLAGVGLVLGCLSWG